ncbi:Hypothetical protein A7982_09463 [Minicystis rosea]|nr:Hypothetical protein A7982_09463 [Minicystis rosea]
MSIELVGIEALGDRRYRLDFRDEGASVSFVFELVPKKGILLTREFDDHFSGRASAREAFEALERFAQGEQVTFPVAVRKDGYIGMG